MKKFIDLPVYEDSIEDMLNKHNITKLIEFERYCRDNALFDKQEECYSKKGSRVRITWFDGDGREFVEKSKKLAKKTNSLYSSPKHKIYNTFVWLNDNKAVAEMQCKMGAYHKLNNILYSRYGYARLLYRLEKEDGTWKIKGLDCIYERDYMYPVTPTNNSFINSKEFDKYRPSYKCISYIFDKQGFPCNNNLPGDDRLDLVDKLYDDASNWLFK